MNNYKIHRIFAGTFRERSTAGSKEILNLHQQVQQSSGVSNHAIARNTPSHFYGTT